MNMMRRNGKNGELRQILLKKLFDSVSGRYTISSRFRCIGCRLLCLTQKESYKLVDYSNIENSL